MTQNYRPISKDNNTHAVRVVTITRYALLAEALHDILDQDSSILITENGSNASDAIALARKIKPQILLLHTTGFDRDVLDVIEQIKVISGETKILLFAGTTNDSIALRLLSAGAYGLLPPETTAQQLSEAIRTLMMGKRFLTDRIQALCAERFLNSDQGKEPEDQLSNREFQVMRLLALGHTNREIARRLSVSIKTIDTHRSKLLKKLGLRNNSDITRFAIKRRFIEI